MSLLLSQVAQWLFNGGVCHAESFDGDAEYYTKEVHFFDSDERYAKGVDFYSRRFEHCIADNSNGNGNSSSLIMDATPNTLLHAQRVRDVYNRAGEDLASKLKMLVILREPGERELSLYHHKKSIYRQMRNAEYLKTTMNEDAWYSDIVSAGGEGGLMSFEEYAKNMLTTQLTSQGQKPMGYYVDYLLEWTRLFDRHQILVLSYDELRKSPTKVQWRIEQFLGKRFARMLPKANAQNEGKVREDKDNEMAVVTGVLRPLYGRKNRELYSFLDDHPGQWMEQYPFPRFEGDNDGVKKSNFAYA